ncbi:MAG: glycosyltransferase [Acidimicrobiia bacterium]
MTPSPRPVVALVPAHNHADTVADTVSALQGLADEVMVVDDGSTDDTADAARGAGASVLRLPGNEGRGAAVGAGVAATAHAGTYLLVDAGLGATAAHAGALLSPVLTGEAEMAVAVLPSPRRLEWVGRLAAAGIRRASGFHARAPLSGQRAVRGELLRSVDLAPRNGLEAALTIDARRLGARVQEVEVPIDHRHGRPSGVRFRHRAGRGIEIARTLWPRLTSVRFRMALIVIAFVAATGGALWLGERSDPPSVAATGVPDKVVIFGLPGLSLDDLGTGLVPHLDEMAAEGAVAAMTSGRGLGPRPDVVEGYATLGAGGRVAVDEHGGQAFDGGAPLEGATAADALARRTGSHPDGEVVVVGAPAVARLNEGRHVASRPGALGEALRRAGRRTAVVGNADVGHGGAGVLRPAAIAVMDESGEVDIGTVDGRLLVTDPAAAFGQRADHGAVLTEALRAVRLADVVVVDPGDLTRAAQFAPIASPEAAARARRRALHDTDRLLGDLRREAPADTGFLAVSLVPATQEWRLTPLVASGPGVVPGYLHSPSTRRVGLVALTDIAPSVLDALGVPVPPGMIGNPLRYRAVAPDLGHLRGLDRDARYRETLYLPLTLAYIVVQAIVYLLAVVAFTRLGGAGRAGPFLRWSVLAVTAYPLATFLFRAVPGAPLLGAGGAGVLVAIDLVVVALALRARRHPLSPLSWVMAATVTVLVADAATGSTLQQSSLLGYSPYLAARFSGLGNTAFATLAATTLLLGAIHVQYAPRRREALLSTACLFVLVVVVDGAPSLGSDVGGILTLVPVFGLTLLALAGRRLSWALVGAGAAVTIVALGAVVAVDLLRPPQARTHLGRLLADIDATGVEAFTTIAARKVSANFRTYGSTWSWTVPIVALYGLYLLGWAGGWTHLLPPRSALRAGIVGALAAGLLGYAVNDSGVVVTAVVFVYVGPFLTLLALHRERGGPLLLPPDPPGAKVAPATVAT